MINPEASLGTRNKQVSLSVIIRDLQHVSWRRFEEDS